MTNRVVEPYCPVASAMPCAIFMCLTLFACEQVNSTAIAYCVVVKLLIRRILKTEKPRI